MSRGLTIFNCPYSLAREAVGRWHYSVNMPAAPGLRYGIRLAGRFVGVVLFGTGANPHIGRPFGLAQRHVRELVRVALSDDRQGWTSQIVAACLHRLRQERPEVRLAVSYADTAHGHHGGLYQAGNWLYLGPAKPSRSLWVHGCRLHTRSVHQRYGTSSLAWLRAHVDPAVRAETDPTKHKYAYPFDSQMRRRLRHMCHPYPRAVKESQATRPATSRKGHVRSVLTAPTHVGVDRLSSPVVK